MNYNLLGNTGLKVSALCLGTMNFGGKGYFKVMGSLDQQAADEQIGFAVDAGINFIDTANVYSAGMSEEMIGRSIQNLNIKRDDLILATKVRGGMGAGPNDRGLSRKHLLTQVEESLKRLKTDYIDLYQIHSSDPATPIEETLKILDDLVRSGKVRYIGASNIAAWHLMKALGYSKYEHKERFESLQAQYSLASRDAERELIPLLQDQQVGLMVWSPLYGGLLSGKYTRQDAEQNKGRLAGFNLQPALINKAFTILDVLHPMAESKGTSVAELALAWLLHQPVVTSVIIGANKLSQLESNVRAIEIKFSDKELQQLNIVSQLTPEYPGNVVEAMAGDRKK